MRKMIFFLCLFLWSGLVVAGWDEAWAAYNKGNYATAAKEFGELAKQGDAGAQFQLGRMYEYGEGVRQDYVQAVKWYRKAAEQGDAGGQNSLGLMYEAGMGVPQDYVLAHMWYNLAATSGDEDAIFNRRRVTKDMSAKQIEKAQRLARNWKPKKTKP